VKGKQPMNNALFWAGGKQLKMHGTSQTKMESGYANTVTQKLKQSNPMLILLFQEQNLVLEAPLHIDSKRDFSNIYFLYIPCQSRINIIYSQT
jgi:hypothetical protein